MATCSCNTVVTSEKKLAVLEMLKHRKSQRSVSVICTVLKSTMANIWQHRVKIESHVSASDCTAFAKKSSQIVN